jgi:hypothetical protein
MTAYVKNDLDALVENLSAEFGFDILDMNRKREFVDARRVFVNIIYKKYDLKTNNTPNKVKLLTLPLLAEYMGFNVHTSVMHLTRNFDHFISYNPFHKAIYEKYSNHSDQFRVKMSSLLEKKKSLEEELKEVNNAIINLKNEQSQEIKGEET